MKALLNFARLIIMLLANRSASFANIPSYTTKSGKVYRNLRINLNVNTTNLKKKWLAKLLAYNLADFDYKNEERNSDVLQEAYDEILQSAKNALLPYEKKNNRAKGQINAYERIHPDCDAILINKNTESVKLMGVFVSGEIVDYGTPKAPSKTLKVRFKRMLEKQVGQDIRIPWTIDMGQVNAFKEEFKLEN